MYSTSDNYKTYIKKPSRMFECKVIVGERTFTNENVIQIVPTTIQPKNGFSIGTTVSQSIEITLKNDGGVYASVGAAEVSIGLKIEGITETIEYIPVGKFNIDTVTKTDYTVKLTCYDNMIRFETGYFSNLGDTVTLQQIVDELKRLTSVDYDITNWTIPNYTVKNLKGYTCREILGYVASVCGGNAYITREGKFTVVIPKEISYQVTADNYINGGYKLEDQAYKIGMITCQNKTKSDTDSTTTNYDSINQQTTISTGSLSTDSMELKFINPWVNESILNDIYNKIGGFSYLGYSMKWQGDISLDAGDIITVVDNKNVTRKALIYANKLTYNGGLVADTSAKGETKNSNSFSMVNSNTELDRIAVKLLIAEKAIITKASISQLEAVDGKIGTLQTAVATINTALINYAKIDDLNATNGNIDTLNTRVGNIDKALIDKANVSDLTATNAIVSNLSTDLGKIQTLVNGNLTSANIHSLVLSSDKVTVDNGFIKNAMIESLNVDKINAGSLSTNKISIASDDGGLLISGATQQFRDSNDKVRLQIGKDAQGNFTFVLVGADGTTALIDEKGVHADAIASGLIRTDMIATKAVTKDKIDYESVFSGFNADTNTTYINSSKVKIGLADQTLDIAFNNLNTKVDGIKTTSDNNTTSITAIQGQISTLISNTTITKDGTTTQLKDAYNGTVATVNSIDTILGEHTSYINSQTGQIETVISRLLSLRSGLDGITLDLGNTKTSLNTTNSNVATLQLGFNDISQRLASTQTKVDNILVGGRNYILASNFQENIYKKYWNLSNLYYREPYIYNNYSYNSLVCDNTGNNAWSETGQTIDGMTSNTEYTFNAMVYGSVFIQIIQVIYDADNNRNDYVVSELSIDNSKYTKYVDTFKTGANVRYGYINIATNKNTVSKIALLKLETGTIATDWTPSPEDVDENIAIVESNVTETINSVSSSITQKVDKISLNVENLQKSVTSINSTLGGKADSLTVENVSKKVSELETSVDKISLSITTINSTIKSNTEAIGTVDKRITDAKDLAISTASADATTKSNSAINSAKTYTDDKIKTTNETVSTMQTSITGLQDSIKLKVEKTDFDSTVSTIDGKIAATNTSIHDAQSSINIKLDSITSQVSETVSTKNLINNSAFKSPLGEYRNTNTPYGVRIVKHSEYSGWGYSKAPTAGDNALYIRYDMTGDNNVEFKNLFAKVKPNTAYTISYYYTLNGEFTAPSSFIYERTAAQENQITYTNPIMIGPDSTTDRSTWIRYTKTFTTRSDTDSIILRFGWHQTHSSGFCEMLIAAIQLEEGTTATNWVEGANSNVGTIITQSPTEVMTAFNGISQYFQVSADGAKFGNIANGDYTVMNSMGLRNHIGTQEYNYMYVTYVQESTINIISKTYQSYVDTEGNATYQEDYYTIPYDDVLKHMLNGRTPLHVLALAYHYVTLPQKPTNDTYYSDTGFPSILYWGNLGVSYDANNITVQGHSCIYTGSAWGTNYTYISGGTVKIRFLIFA